MVLHCPQTKTPVPAEGRELVPALPPAFADTSRRQPQRVPIVVWQARMPVPRLRPRLCNGSHLIRCGSPGQAYCGGVERGLDLLIRFSRQFRSHLQRAFRAPLLSLRQARKPVLRGFSVAATRRAYSSPSPLLDYVGPEAVVGGSIAMCSHAVNPQRTQVPVSSRAPLGPDRGRG